MEHNHDEGLRVVDDCSARRHGRFNARLDVGKRQPVAVATNAPMEAALAKRPVARGYRGHALSVESCDQSIAWIADKPSIAIEKKRLKTDNRWPLKCAPRFAV